MITSPRLIAVPALALLGVALLAGCSSSEEAPPAPAPSVAAPSTSTAPVPDASTDPAASPTDTAASPTDTVVGGDPSTWAPVMITPTTTDLALVPGQVAVFDGLGFDLNGEPITVTSSDEAVVMVSQPSADTQATVQAVAPGMAAVTVNAGGVEGLTIAITVTAEVPVMDAPVSEEPVVEDAPVEGVEESSETVTQ